MPQSLAKSKALSLVIFSQISTSMALISFAIMCPRQNWSFLQFLRWLHRILCSSFYFKYLASGFLFDVGLPIHWKLYFHFLSNWMGYEKLSPRSYPIQFERKLKYSFLSVSGGGWRGEGGDRASLTPLSRSLFYLANLLFFLLTWKNYFYY